MKLSKQLEQIKQDVSRMANKALTKEAIRVSKYWKSLILERARQGESSIHFTEMTLHLKKIIPEATDYYTVAYLEKIAEIFRTEGLSVSKPYRIQNPNGFQARIDLTW